MLQTDITRRSDELDIAVEESGAGAIVRLHGRLGIDSATKLRNLLLAILEKRSCDGVTLDLAELSYIDSAGLATLIEALKIARNRRTSLELKGLQGRVLDLFEVSGVLALFQTGRSATVGES